LLAARIARSPSLANPSIRFHPTHHDFITIKPEGSDRANLESAAKIRAASSLESDQAEEFSTACSPVTEKPVAVSPSGSVNLRGGRRPEGL
jgi:hypothetical protein